MGRPPILTKGPTSSVLYWTSVCYAFLLLVPMWSRFVGAVPDGFIAEVVTDAKAVRGIFAPNPRNGNKPMLILTAKLGTVSVLEDPDHSPTSILILDLRIGGKIMCTNGERGLQNIVLHPDFETNRIVYLYYNKYKQGCFADFSDRGPWNVIAQFVMNPETLMLDYDSRKEIWRYVGLSPCGSHAQPSRRARSRPGRGSLTQHVHSYRTAWLRLTPLSVVN